MEIKRCLIGGVILREKKETERDQKFLVVHRKIEPKMWAFPSFHIVIDNSSSDATKTEGQLFNCGVKKELGIAPHDIKKLNTLVKEHLCRLYSKYQRVTIHTWVIYEIKSYNGEVKNERTDKYDKMEFMKAEQIKKLIADRQFAQIWVDILPWLNISAFNQ